MAKRICLLTGNETTCNDSCYRCDCGGEVALNDYYVPIYDIQRVCDIVCGMDISLDSDETGEYIRNELEKMTVVKTDVQPVKCGKWLHFNNDINFIFCSDCKREAYWDTDHGYQLFDYCPYCGAKMAR